MTPRDEILDAGVSLHLVGLMFNLDIPAVKQLMRQYGMRVVIVEHSECIVLRDLLRLDNLRHHDRKLLKTLEHVQETDGK